jgi:hypothetical protein
MHFSLISLDWLKLIDIPGYMTVISFKLTINL